MLQELPIDIINSILISLDQLDVLSLARTSKYLNRIATPKLYHSITVDSSKTQLQHCLHRKTTTIKYLHSFKVFLKGLVKNPQFGQFIKYFAFKNEIPDMPEIMLNEYLEQIFPTLININALSWFIVDTYLSFHLLECLPLRKLSSIGGNFKNYNASKHVLSEPLLNLKELEISGFNTATNLSILDLRKFPNLQLLVILKNSSGKPDGLSDLIEIDPIDEDYLSKLFIHSQHLNLFSLTLKDINISKNNIKDLLKTVNLSILKNLEIVNCNEILFQDNAVVRRTAPPELFLDVLSPHLSSLESLTLGLLNELSDNNSILRFLNTTHLYKLDILITCKNGESLTEDLNGIIDSLISHPLSELKLDFQFPNISYEKVTIPIKTLISLSKLSSLKTLTAPVEHSHFNSLMPIVSELSELSVLHLILNTKKTSNSLVDRNYFYFAIPHLIYQQSNSLTQFYNYCKKFKLSNQNLQYLIFETSQKFMFKCRNSIELIET